jgi:transposase
LVIAIETALTVAWCMRCGTRAQAHDRMPIEIRDLSCFGRPARLVWRKRRWRCCEPAGNARRDFPLHSEHVFV